MEKKKSFILFVVINILIAVVTVAVMVWITFAAIDRYTEHGVEKIVPDLRGAYVPEAEILLRAQGLFPRVIDSVFVRNKPLGTIVEQVPPPNARMKRNRPVYVTINSRQIPQVALPHVVDFSARQAEATLTASGLRVERTEFVPAQFQNLVLDVLYRGESVQAGHRIPQGGSVVLVVGRGLGEEKIPIPDLVGMTLEQARRTIMNASFIIGASHNHNDESQQQQFVFRQDPAVGSVVPIGTRINLWFTADREVLNEAQQRPQRTQEDDFF